MFNLINAPNKNYPLWPETFLPLSRSTPFIICIISQCSNYPSFPFVFISSKSSLKPNGIEHPCSSTILFIYSLLTLFICNKSLLFLSSLSKIGTLSINILPILDNFSSLNFSNSLVTFCNSGNCFSKLFFWVTSSSHLSSFFDSFFFLPIILFIFPISVCICSTF